MKLTKITGWTKLSFTHDGTLSLAAPEIFNGSKSARSLVSHAVAGENVIVLMLPSVNCWPTEKFYFVAGLKRI